MAKKKQKETLSLDEEMLMWTSYRYCIGRKSYVNSLASYIGKKYYHLLSDERAEITAQDIRRCISDTLHFGAITFTYEGSVSEKERDALSDFLIWLTENVTDSKDLHNIDTITCYKDSYKADAPKKYFTTKTHRLHLDAYEHDFSDLIVWHTLSSLFDKKNHKILTVNYNGEEKKVEAFECWCKKIAPIENEPNYYRAVPWKYTKAYITVEAYLNKGEHAPYVNEEYIIKIEDKTMKK